MGLLLEDNFLLFRGYRNQYLVSTQEPECERRVVARPDRIADDFQAVGCYPPFQFLLVLLIVLLTPEA